MSRAYLCVIKFDIKTNKSIRRMVVEKLKLFLQNKKEKSNKQLPKYRMRKLSVGLILKNVH